MASSSSAAAGDDADDAAAAPRPPPPPPRPASAASESTKPRPNPNPSPKRRRGAAEKLWTEAEEMAILDGFLEFVTERGTPHAPYQHETAPFFDRIRTRLRRADLNRAQLAEKLRRLKKKYRAAAARIGGGPAPAAAFKTPHDRATFEVARKIWSPALNRGGVSATSSAAAAAPSPEAGDKAMEEKWRKQQILELEVLLKRAELLHEHFSAKLREMRSTPSTS